MHKSLPKFSVDAACLPLEAKANRYAKTEASYMQCVAAQDLPAFGQLLLCCGLAGVASTFAVFSKLWRLLKSVFVGRDPNAAAK